MKVSTPVLVVVILFGYFGLYAFGGITSQNASVNSSPHSIIVAVATGFFAVWFPRVPREDEPERPVGIWQRFWACQIDGAVAIMLLSGTSIAPILIIEYLATGQWQWSYVREEWKARDVFSVLSLFLVFYGCYYYFYKHAALGRPTPGQYIIGYRIVPAETGVPKFKTRVLYAAIANAFSLFTLFFTRKNKTGIYFWDEDSNTRAIAMK